MKVNTDNRRLSFMSLFLATAISMGAVSVAHAQYDLEDAEDAIGSDALEMDQIEIEGKLSPSELMKRRREKLEERNKVMVEKKIEDIRVKQEIALTNKLQGAFNSSLNNLNEDKVQTVQAAPAPAPVAPAPVIETRIIEVAAPVERVEKKSKIIPNLGVQSIKGDRIDLETNVTLGVAAETMVAPQISVGIGFSYATMDLTDVSNEFLNTGYGNTNNSTGYYNTYGAGRKMKLSKMSIEGNSKYFFIEDAMIKPYLGGALSYNRTKLKYENSSPYSNGGYSYGNEDLGSSTIAGAIRLGAEMSFNDTVGANVEFGYTKNISSGISKSAELNATNNPDQGRLENISKEIEDASATAIQAGVVIKF